MRNSGTVRRFVAVLALAALAVTVVAAVSFEPSDPAALVALGVALVLVRAAVFRVSLGRSSWSLTLEEAVLVPAFVLLPPATVVLLRVASEPLAQALKRSALFSPQPPTPFDLLKAGFSAASMTVATGVAAAAFAVWGPDGAVERVTAGTVAALIAGVVVSVLVARVRSWIEGRHWGQVLRVDLRGDRAPLLLALWLGVVTAAASVMGSLPLVWPLGSAVILATASRLVSGIELDRTRVEALLGAGGSIHQASGRRSLDQALYTAAAQLLAVERVEVRETAPGGGEIGAPFAGRWLVASEPTGRDRPLDEHDERMLTSLSAIALTALHNATLIEKLEAQDQLRADLLAAVSHDVRSPLHSVVFGLRTIRLRRDDLDAATLDTLVDASLREAERAERLVSDLLDVQRIEHGAAETVSGVSDPADVAQRVARDHPRLADLRIDVSGARVQVAVDETWLERILENVLVNAVKHSPPGSSVRVDIASEDATVVITVSDEGPGIPASVRGAVMEAFTQGGAEREGVGLGLYITRRFVEHAHGHIELFDSEERGTAVRIRLPLAGGGDDGEGSGR